MAMLSIRTILATLLAGSLALGANTAMARGDSTNFDPAKMQQRIEKRVDRALSGTDATAEQKKKIIEIMQTALGDMRPLHVKRVENRKAMADAMQAPTIDRIKLEQLRIEQMKMADESSRRFTKALGDAGDLLNQSQRQAFFKKWGERFSKRG